MERCTYHQVTWWWGTGYMSRRDAVSGKSYTNFPSSFPETYLYHGQHRSHSNYYYTYQVLTYSDLLKYLPCQERAGGARVTSSQITLLSLPQVQAVLANSSLIASIYSVCKRTMSPIIPLHHPLRHLPPCLPQRPLQTSALDLPRHNYHSSRTMSTHAFQESEAQFPTWSSALAQP